MRRGKIIVKMGRCARGGSVRARVACARRAPRSRPYSRGSPPQLPLARIARRTGRLSPHMVPPPQAHHVGCMPRQAALPPRQEGPRTMPGPCRTLHPVPRRARPVCASSTRLPWGALRRSLAHRMPGYRFPLRPPGIMHARAVPALAQPLPVPLCSPRSPPRRAGRGRTARLCMPRPRTRGSLQPS